MKSYNCMKLVFFIRLLEQKHLSAMKMSKTFRNFAVVTKAVCW